MKNRIIPFIMLLTVLSCGNRNTGSGETGISNQDRNNRADHLEVYCFHGTRQCETCINMKALTAKTLTTYFTNELKDSSILFQIVDVDEKENELLAARFQATGTALMVNRVRDGKDSIIDLSDLAFELAHDETKFIPELKQHIESIRNK